MTINVVMCNVRILLLNYYNLIKVVLYRGVYVISIFYNSLAKKNSYTKKNRKKIITN